MASVACERAVVVLAVGHRRERELSQDEQVALWARCLHAGADGLVELAVGRRRADGSLEMRSRSERARYPRAGDVHALVALAARHRAAGEELFATPLARRRPLGGRKAGVLPGAVCWVDIDRAEDIERLREFRHRPVLVVRSGSGGAHAYWRLDGAAAPDAIEEANRKLAGALGGCISCACCAAIMRLPGSENHKHDPPRPARIAHVDLARPGVALEQLVAGLADPQPKPPPPDPGTLRRFARHAEGDPARQVPPPVYFARLARIEVPDSGATVRCPLPDHDDSNASLEVFPDPGRGWVCRGCGRGGSIYDLASLLDGGPGGTRGALRGEEFKRARRRVRELLGLAGN